MKPRLATPPSATGVPAGIPIPPCQRGQLYSNTSTGLSTADIDGGCEGRDARRAGDASLSGCVNAGRLEVGHRPANPANVDGGGRASAFPHIICGLPLRALDLDDGRGRHRPIAAEACNKFLNQLADHSRALFVGRHRAGPFIDLSFHSHPNSEATPI